MTWLDYVLLAVVLISVMVGLLRGFIKEVLSLLIWVVVFGVALWFFPVVSGYMQHVTDKPDVQYTAAIIVLCLAALVLGVLLHFLVMMMVSESEFSAGNRILGAVFGLVRGGLFAVILVLILAIAGLNEDPVWHDSKTLPFFLSLGRAVQSMVMTNAPDHVADVLKSVSEKHNLKFSS
jgi:membrane protein required for colicin V production